jgi:hypothetical protein
MRPPVFLATSCRRTAETHHLGAGLICVRIANTPTTGEKKRVNKEQDASSKNIYNKKHRAKTQPKAEERNSNQGIRNRGPRSGEARRLALHYIASFSVQPSSLRAARRCSRGSPTTL